MPVYTILGGRNHCPGPSQSYNHFAAALRVWCFFFLTNIGSSFSVSPVYAVLFLCSYRCGLPATYYCLLYNKGCGDCPVSRNMYRLRGRHVEGKLILSKCDFNGFAIHFIRCLRDLRYHYTMNSRSFYNRYQLHDRN